MRIKRGIISRKRHNKLFRSVKGFRMTKRRLVKVAKEASLHAGNYAYQGRKDRKSDFRRLWITRIGQKIKEYGTNYSIFMKKMKEKNIIIDRKIMSDLILHDEQAFKAIFDKANSK